MKEESKVILGQEVGKFIYFSDDEKKLIIEEYLAGNETKKEVFRKYTGRESDHGTIIRWMREFGYFDKEKPVKTIQVMSKKKNEAESFENLQLKRRVAELEKQLKDAEMKAIAFSTMVDIAEKEFQIPIRKKFNTKP